MKQRELEVDGLKWSCVQALSGGTGEAAAAAERKIEADGHVPVVCTPRGEAQSVRLTLHPDSAQSISDEQLAQAIGNAHHGP